MKEFHLSVMPKESIEYLLPAPGKIFIDCTLGGAGHTEELLKITSPNGKVIGIDLDQLAIDTAKKALKEYGNRAMIVKDNFANLKNIIKKYKIPKVDGVLLDLGLSSGQLRDKKRGFSFLSEGKLDMRFGEQTDLTAERILNTARENELVEIFQEFGQERLSRPIAKAIVEQRRVKAITHPEQLVEIISDIYKKYFREKSRTNPATKIFQALRIAVNDELKNLEKVLPAAISVLKPGGRLVVISYHSLEDKIVKDFLRQESRDCICPPQMPLCQCGHKKTVKLLTLKPLEPTESEIRENPRSRSAKMRVAEKINKN